MHLGAMSDRNVPEPRSGLNRVHDLQMRVVLCGSGCILSAACNLRSNFFLESGVAARNIPLNFYYNFICPMAMNLSSFFGRVTTSANFHNRQLFGTVLGRLYCSSMLLNLRGFCIRWKCNLFKRLGNPLFIYYSAVDPYSHRSFGPVG